MRITGIDPDTKAITIAIYDGESEVAPEIFRLEAKGRRAEDRIAGLWLAMTGTPAFDAPPDWTYVERPMVVRNAKAAIDQSIVVGMLRAVLWERGALHSLVDPGTWKKGLLGTGHASKEEIAAYAMAFLSIPADQPQDAYDAACIAAWGMLNAPKSLGGK